MYNSAGASINADAMKIDFVLASVKYQPIIGKTINIVTTPSFDIKAKKNINKETTKAHIFDLENQVCKNSNVSIKKKNDIISSLLLMFATTSVCMGWAVYNKAISKGKTG